MVGPSTSNVYVSITRQPDKGDGHGTRRPEHTWLLSVEPHHSAVRVPGVSHKDAEPIHYGASLDHKTGKFTITAQPSENAPAIIGNILVAESAKTSVEKVHTLLEQALGPNSSLDKSNQQYEDEPELWIRSALHTLHQNQIGEQFDIDQFMTFAHGYMANRQEDEAPALIAYPKAHKEPEKKDSKHKFWISHPTAQTRTKTNSRGEATTYGGLM